MDVTSRFLLGVACLLLLTHAAGRLARRARQPAVLAELAVGVLLGPTLLGAAAPWAHRLLFGPEVLPALDSLAQLGLVLYAAGIGRALALPAARHPSGGTVLAVSAVSFLAPTVAGVLLAPALGDRFSGPDATPLAFALFLGCALSITALPVLARLLQDEGLTDTPVGRLSLTSAAVGDAAAWCVLTAALVAARSAPPERLLLAVAGVPVAALLLRTRGRAAREGKPTPPAQDLALLAAGCALAAALSAAVGLHQLVGALVFGYLRGRRHHGPDPALDTLGRVAGAVLLPCFFLGFGQRLDLGAVAWTAGFTGLVALLLLIAVVVKAVGCAAVAVLHGLSTGEALRLGALMNARGLTEIVVLTVGHEAGLIDRDLLVALTVVALATTAATGPALRLLDRLRPTTSPAAPLPAPTSKEPPGSPRPASAPAAPGTTADRTARVVLRRSRLPCGWRSFRNSP